MYPKVFWVDNEITTKTNTRWEATEKVMVAKLTRLTHKIAIQPHLVAENCTICSSRSRRPVLELLDIPPYRSMHSLTSWRWVVSFTPRSLYPRYPLDRKLGGPQSRCGDVGEEKYSQAPPGIEPPNHDCPARSQSLYRLSYPGSLMRRVLFFYEEEYPSHLWKIRAAIFLHEIPLCE
jgi:hypothetical protein